jgi:8-oxo-dGTP pyrophosphatase MutT (NUDIX family)
MRRKMRSIQKVTAFVTRVVGSNLELLLMEHPMAGIQLPAGTVELSETAEAAVLREVAEETGLEPVRIIRELGRIKVELPENERIISRVTKLFDAPASDASSVGGYGLHRGSPVKVLRNIDTFAEVLCDPLDLSQVPPVRVNGVQGYVRRSLLVGKTERYLFHMTLTEAAPDQIESLNDGVLFRCFWEPLVPKPELHPAQQNWLDEVYPVLLASKVLGIGKRE